MIPRVKSLLFESNTLRRIFLNSTDLLFLTQQEVQILIKSHKILSDVKQMFRNHTLELRKLFCCNIKCLLMTSSETLKFKNFVFLTRKKCYQTNEYNV